MYLSHDVICIFKISISFVVCEHCAHRKHYLQTVVAESLSAISGNCNSSASVHHLLMTTWCKFVLTILVNCTKHPVCFFRDHFRTTMVSSQTTPQLALLLSTSPKIGS
jgi:hypothetical protein